MKKIKYFYLIFFLSSNLLFVPVKADLIFEMGKTIFLEQGNCGTCHKLVDAKSNGQIGPNLNQLKPDIMRVISVVTNGIGVMPSYERVLSAKEIHAVAHYVSISANQ
jgi:mono/diheme cytochrome c family protein